MLTLLALLSSLAFGFMDPSVIKKQFKEPGHIPQGLKPVGYHKLNEVIPVATQVKLKKTKIKFKSQKADSIAADIDLRQFDSAMRSQWDGTCTAHGLVAGVENLFNRTEKTHLSTRYFWSLYKQYSAEAAIKTTSKRLFIENKYWPQDTSKVKKDGLLSHERFQLVDNEYLHSNAEAALRALSKRLPVYVAMSVPSDLAACRASVRPSTRMVDGGHAMAIVGYHLDPVVSGGGYFILKNSWGDDCGDKGYQYLPIGLCSRADMYCMFWSLKEVKHL